MVDIAICAKCGEEKGLCGSGHTKGIQQPRICKDCLLLSMQTGDYGINDVYWLMQIQQLGDEESMVNLHKQIEANKSFIKHGRGEN